MRGESNTAEAVRTKLCMVWWGNRWRALTAVRTLPERKQTLFPAGGAGPGLYCGNVGVHAQSAVIRLEDQPLPKRAGVCEHLLAPSNIPLCEQNTLPGVHDTAGYPRG
eukprot:gene4578-biopygen2474